MPKLTAEQQPVSGSQPLLPIHKHFFQDPVDLHHFNQSVLLSLKGEHAPASLRAMLAQLYCRHDSLSIRYQQQDGQWQGTYSPDRDNHALAEQALAVVDLRTSSEQDYRDYVDRFQAGFDLADGVLFKAALIELPESMCDGPSSRRLLLVGHHLAVDGISWRVLLDDLAQLQQLSSQGETLDLPPKTASCQQWGEFLHAYADTEQVQGQRQFWLDSFDRESVSFAKLCTKEGAEVSDVTEQLSFALDESLTAQLLGDCHKPYRTTINELLLAALMLGVNRFSGEQVLRLDLEGHGRENLDESLDLSQTVGWFTALYPLQLVIDSDQPGHIINQIKTLYRAVPQKGIGFGLHQSGGCAEFAALAERELVFNYLGQFDQVDENPWFAMAPEYGGQSISSARRPWHGLTLTGVVSEGCFNLGLKCRQGQYDSAKLGVLMDDVQQALKEIIHHCQMVESAAHAPVDFPLATLSAADLADWQASYGEIEDIYPATGMQQGLLFHSLLEAGSYITQFVLSFDDVDVARLKQAWQAVLTRHGALRTVFAGLDSESPQQLVLPRVTLDWQEYDLSVLGEAEQGDSVEQLRLEIKREGFAAGQAPLMSLALVKLAERRHQLIWSHHHALIDGWCLPIIFDQLNACYRSLAGGTLPTLAEAPKYRDYAAWLGSRDMDEARAYWRQTLAGVDSKTPLPLANAGLEVDTDKGLQREVVSFSDEQTQQLVAFAKQARVTVNILVQAAWSLVLGKYACTGQVVFGATTSGRPPELDGVNNMVGLFINTVPVVCEVAMDKTVGSWLQGLHAEQQERERHSHVPLHEIQRLSQLSQDLFDTLVIFENYPVNVLGDDSNEAGLPVSHMQSFDQTNYPITLTARLLDTLTVDMEIFAGHLADKHRNQIGQLLKSALLSLAADQGRTPVRGQPLLA